MYTGVPVPEAMSATGIPSHASCPSSQVNPVTIRGSYPRRRVFDTPRYSRYSAALREAVESRVLAA